MCDWLAIDVMSCVLRDQVRLYDGLLRSDTVHGDAQKFIAWGSPDLLVISRFSGIEHAKQIYHRHTDLGIFDRQVYYGHVIGGTSRSLKEITDHLPLVGISFLKVKRHLIKNIPIDHLGFGAYGWLREQMENRVLPEVERALPCFKRQEFEYVLCSASGWADAILVCFSTSYAPMQLVLSGLRRTTVKDALMFFNVDVAKDVGDCPKHALVTTCTIPGTHVPSLGKSANRRGMTAASWLHQRLADWDDMTRAVISVHAKPGHLVDAMTHFPQGKRNIVATFGRTDFIVEAKRERHAGILEHHQFCMTDLFPKTQDSTSSIGWTETRIGFLGSVFRAEPGPQPIEKRKVRASSALDVKVWADTSFSRFVPSHTGGALKQIGLSLKSLIEHEATSEFYESVALCYEVACRNAIERAEMLSNEPDREGSGTFAGSLGQLCERLDLCFKDRYRGSYPAGAMSAVPALTSQASFHTTLSVMDDVANEVLDTIYGNYWSQAPDLNAKRCRRFAACCHLGNSSVPQVDVPPLLGVGFINVPTELMFAPEGLAYILHETGHILWHNVLPEFGANFPRVLMAKSGFFVKLLEDALCDFVSLSAVFCGDSIRMYNEYKEILNGLLPSSMHSSMEILNVRIMCAYILSESLREGPAAQMLDAYARAIKDSPQSVQDDKEKPLIGCLEELIRTLSKMVKASPRFLLMLQSVLSLEKPAQTNNNPAPLAEIQQYFQKKRGMRNREEFIYRLRHLQQRCS